MNVKPKGLENVGDEVKNVSHAEEEASDAERNVLYDGYECPDEEASDNVLSDF